MKATTKDFHYNTGEEALRAAKAAVRGHSGMEFTHKRLDEGSECFFVSLAGNVVERHIWNTAPYNKSAHPSG